MKSKRTVTFKNHPILDLIDVNGDRSPDMFSYSPKSGGNSQDFGFIFDLNKDGKADYLVFNQGTQWILNPFRIVATFHHWIDSDNDGKIDVLVFPDVDLNGDRAMDGEGVFAWMYDINKDGKIDKGEHLGNNFQQTMAVENGKINAKCVMQAPSASSYTEFLERASKMLTDINSMMN